MSGHDIEGPSDSGLKVPRELPRELRSPGKPVCILHLAVEGASVKAKFDTAPVISAFVETFAKKVQKKCDVQVAQQAPGKGVHITVHIMRLDEGNRLLRFLFPFLSIGATCFEAEGVATGETGKEKAFRAKKYSVAFLAGSIFSLGGSGRTLLKRGAKAVAGKAANCLLRCS